MRDTERRVFAFHSLIKNCVSSLYGQTFRQTVILWLFCRFYRLDKIRNCLAVLVVLNAVYNLMSWRVGIPTRLYFQAELIWNWVSGFLSRVFAYRNNTKYSPSLQEIIKTGAGKLWEVSAGIIFWGIGLYPTFYIAVQHSFPILRGSCSSIFPLGSMISQYGCGLNLRP